MKFSIVKEYVPLLGYTLFLPELGGGGRCACADQLGVAPDGVVLLEALVLHPEAWDEAPARHVHRLD